MSWIERLGLAPHAEAPVDARTHSGSGQAVLHSPEKDPASSGKVESEKKNPEEGDIYKTSDGDLIKFSVGKDGTVQAHIMAEKADGTPSEHAGKDYFGDISQLEFVRKAEGVKEEGTEKKPAPKVTSDQTIEAKAQFSPEQQEIFDFIKNDIFAIHEQFNETVLHVTSRLESEFEKIESEEFNTLTRDLKQIVAGFKKQADLYENTVKTERNPNFVLQFSDNQLDLLRKSLGNLDNFARKLGNKLHSETAATSEKTAVSAPEKGVKQRPLPEAGAGEEVIQTKATFTAEQERAVGYTDKKISEVRNQVSALVEEMDSQLTDGKKVLSDEKFDEYKQIIENSINLMNLPIQASDLNLKQESRTHVFLEQQKTQLHRLNGSLRDLERISVRLSKEIGEAKIPALTNASKKDAMPNAGSSSKENVVDLQTVRKKRQEVKGKLSQTKELLLQEMGEEKSEQVYKILRSNAEEAWEHYAPQNKNTVRSEQKAVWDENVSRVILSGLEMLQTNPTNRQAIVGALFVEVVSEKK